MKYSNLLKKIKANSKAGNLIFPLEAAAFVLLLSLVAALIDDFMIPPEESFSTGVRIFIVALALTLFTYIFIRIKYRLTTEKTAKKTDSLFCAKNRMESAVELENSNNLLIQYQLDETENFYKQKKILSLIPFVCILLFLLGSILVMHITLLTVQLKKTLSFSLVPELAVRRNYLNLKNKKTSKDESFAEIEFISPESEKRAKPMDVIEWQAKAFSTEGFNSITVSLFVNGEFKTEIPVEPTEISIIPDYAPGDYLNTDKFEKLTSEKDNRKNTNQIHLKPLTKNKNIIFSGEFYLDELEVMPFDLVSYNIKASAPLNARNNEQVVSQPQFIEIRPFREDAAFLKLKNLKNTNDKEYKKLLKLLALINKFLNYQLKLNKALFSIRASGLKPENKVLLNEIKRLTKNQETLKIKLDKMLEKIPAENISSNMLDYLSNAKEEMKQASEYLEKIK
jgi:hypothetical protein